VTFIPTRYLRGHSLRRMARTEHRIPLRSILRISDCVEPFFYEVLVILKTLDNLFFRAELHPALEKSFMTSFGVLKCELVELAGPSLSKTDATTVLARTSLVIGGPRSELNSKTKIVYRFQNNCKRKCPVIIYRGQLCLFLRGSLHDDSIEIGEFYIQKHYVLISEDNTFPAIV